MSEQQNHINLWADKLQQVSLPAATLAWKGMEALLDQEMPATRKKDWRRWLLLVLLLLLLIGVCNCPGVQRLTGFTTHENTVNESGANKEAAAGTGGHEKNSVVTGHTDSTTHQPGGDKRIAQEKKQDSAITNTTAPTGINKEDQQTNTATAHIPVPGNKNVLPTKSHKYVDNSQAGQQSLPLKTTMHLVTPHKKHATAPVTVDTKNGESNISVNNGKKRSAGQHHQPLPKEAGATGDTEKEKASETNTAEKHRVPGNDSTQTAETVNTPATKQNPVADSNTKKTAQVKRLPKKPTDSSTKKDKEPEPNIKGWAIAIGLNQFFPVGQQEKSGFNSDGTTGGLKDYIPVPQVRYHFNRKLYVQVEAQFNAPQYTSNVLASQTTNTTAGTTLQSSVFIKKLFYFNLPFSVHYSPVKNLYLGAGLQFSQLSNGVALFDNRTVSVSRPDTVKSQQVKSFKNEAVYQKLKTTEWRFLFDINYHWKPVILGVRYNQAFTNFINVQLPTGQITQAHNSSLQLYLRYTLYRSKGLKPPKPPAGK